MLFILYLMKNTICIFRPVGKHSLFDFCCVWFDFTSQPTIFHVGMGLPRINQYLVLSSGYSALLKDTTQ